MIKKEVIVTGATTDEAIENGCAELGEDFDKVKFEILELPKTKTLGLFGGSPAKVRVYVENNRGEIAADYLRNIIDAMGIDSVEIELEENEDGSGASLNLTGENLGAVIGRRGETLTALQYLVSLAANNSDEDYYRVAINISNYREKRESSLENLAKKTAARSVKIGKNLALDPMNPYERRIIHTAVQSVEGATSWSVGEDAKRHVVIGPVGVDEGGEGLPVNHNRGRSNYNSRGYSRGGYGDRQRSGGYQNRSGRGDYGERSGRGGYHNRSGRGGYGGNRGGSYNGGYGGGYKKYNNSSYNNNYSAQDNEVQREAKRDTTAPLYGRIEVKKKPESSEE